MQGAYWLQELLSKVTAGSSPIIPDRQLLKGLEGILGTLVDVGMDAPFAPDLVSWHAPSSRLSLATGRLHDTQL